MESYPLSFILSSLAGLFAVVGSLALFWRRQIYVDVVGQNKPLIEVPFGVKLRTQLPVLLLFLGGVALLALPVYYEPHLCPDMAFHQKQPLEWLALRGHVITNSPVQINVVVDTQQAARDQVIDMHVPAIPGRHYLIRYTNSVGYVLWQETIRPQEGAHTYQLREVNFTPLNSTLAGEPRLATNTPRQLEPTSVVAEFKPQ